jgi:hypothetical protein
VVNTIGYGVVAGLLWPKELPSLRRLRGFELLVFGEGLLTIYINNWYVLNTGGWLPELFQLHQINILATWQAHSWFVIIAGYGTLIPNTGRRCALVVGSFALAAMAIAASSLAANSVSRADALLYLFHLGVSMMLAIGLAVVGSHRLEALRREASEARRLGQYQLKVRPTWTRAPISTASAPWATTFSPDAVRSPAAPRSPCSRLTFMSCRPL